MKKNILLLTILMIISLNLHGQKTRDDIFALIQNKEFQSAEKAAIEYLSKNEKDGIVHLWLGELLFRKAQSLSDNSSSMINAADSALIEYSKASSYLIASEVKNNSIYFKKYERRDLRTGNYTIKYEDISYDIESKKGKTSSILLKVCKENNFEVIIPRIENQSDIRDNNKSKFYTDGKYYALIIGISDYDNYKLNLTRPTLDAKRLRNLLVSKYNFESSDVKLLLNPTRQDILSELYSLRKILTKADNLLIFYAGHGMYDEDAGQGYWWPKNADSESPSNWLSNSDLRDQIRGIKASHVLLISDACFSGGIFRTRGTQSIRDASFDIISLYKLPSRRAITSGTMTTVPDNSIFFDYLLKTLESNANEYLSSQKLIDSFRAIVINNTLQIPQDGIISETGDEGGDFIFIKRDD